MGAAIAGALAATIYPAIEPAVKAMTGIKPKIYEPIAKNVAVYRELYRIYKTLHDAFGLAGHVSVDRVMKDLLKIKTKACR